MSASILNSQPGLLLWGPLLSLKVAEDNILGIVTRENQVASIDFCPEIMGDLEPFDRVSAIGREFEFPSP